MNDLTQSLVTQQLAYLRQKQFTGQVIIQSNFSVTWYIYLCCGRLVWTDGGIHPNRSWKRLINKHCPGINWQELALKNFDWFECENYCILTLLLNQQLITREQAFELIITNAREAIFDLLHLETETTLKIILETASATSCLVSNSTNFIALLNIETVVESASKTWQIWQQKGFQLWSPNLAPKIKHQDELKTEVSEIVYQNFLKLLDGKKTLRDLSYLIDKDIIKLTFSIIPYVRQGLLTLIEVKDINSPKYTLKSFTGQSQSQSQAVYKTHLVVCIDDSPQICQVMKQIVTNSGYHFIDIQESLRALPTLIETNPNLIFLDIGMPIVNGYELCSQIRRVSKLKDIPIVILTGNDSIVDRVRAKVVGANAFVSKPIDVDKINKIIQKFC